jgi:hypothetical protein
VEVHRAFFEKGDGSFIKDERARKKDALNTGFCCLKSLWELKKTCVEKNASQY